MDKFKYEPSFSARVWGGFVGVASLFISIAVPLRQFMRDGVESFSRNDIVFPILFFIMGIGFSLDAFNGTRYVNKKQQKIIEIAAALAVLAFIAMMIIAVISKPSASAQRVFVWI